MESNGCSVCGYRDIKILDEQGYPRLDLSSNIPVIPSKDGNQLTNRSQ